MYSLFVIAPHDLQVRVMLFCRVFWDDHITLHGVMLCIVCIPIAPDINVFIAPHDLKVRGHVECPCKP